MAKFKEDHYETVLDRIFIRAHIDEAWVNISLRAALVRLKHEHLDKVSDSRSSHD